MGDIDCHCMAMVSLDEVQRMDCEVAGQHGFSMRSYTPWGQHLLQRWRGPARDAPVDLMGVGVIGAEYAAELIWALFSMANDRQMTYTISINGKMAWNL